MDGPELASSALSHIGPVREENQDAVRLPEGNLAAERGFLYGLADGMGGYAHGALASRLALATLYDAFYQRNGASGQSALRQGVEKANFEVFKKAQQLGGGRMGTTLTAAFVDGSSLFLAHVGDSRLYLVRGGQPACLTSDHTQVGELVRARVIAAERVREHPNRSILTRAVGLSMFVRPELSQVRLQEGDRLVLCSDGLWGVVQDHELGRMVTQAVSPEEASQALVDLGLERQTDDNLSVVAVFVGRLPHRAVNSNLLLGPSWMETLKKWFPPRML